MRCPRDLECLPWRGGFTFLTTVFSSGAFNWLFDPPAKTQVHVIVAENATAKKLPGALVELTCAGVPALRGLTTPDRRYSFQPKLADGSRDCALSVRIGRPPCLQKIPARRAIYTTAERSLSISG